MRARWIRPALALLLLLLGGLAYSIWARRGSGRLVAEGSPEGATQLGELARRAAGSYPRPGPGFNLLALEASPYLQLHARNPVDWYPWGEAALARARAEGKPVFLSVGYSTCYWCHVMEREVFSDPEIAALMNANFVSIKVDREERPDVDEIYMRATHLLTGSGGWPNSVFLTPEGKPFYAGTYFPPADAPGRPGFPRVLAALHDAWVNQRDEVLRAAEEVADRIAILADLGAKSGGTSAPPPAEVLGRALGALVDDYDPEHGGFGSRMKFPRPPALELLLATLERERDPGRLAVLTHTLDEMALGGIYDHLAGGFHRYATEPSWSIPHFEKMLYDNAQLVGVYARAYALTRRPLYRRVVEETVAYLDREMSHPEGGFASAQDAEVAGVEGASYVWQRDEVERVLGPERARGFLSVYELVPMRENPAFGVLRFRRHGKPASGAGNLAGLDEGLDDERAALLAARNRRPQPPRDDKVLAAWNGLAIRGLVQAGESLDRPTYVQRAARAASFVLARLATEEGSLRRSYIAGQARERGVLDDYAFVSDALLALHRATGESRWLHRARGIADEMLARFQDAEHGGFYLTEGDSQLLVRPKPFEDSERPSGNAVALRALGALAEATGETRYSEAAAGVTRAAAPLLRQSPGGLAAMVAALGPEPSGASTTVAGERKDPSNATSKATTLSEFRLPRSEDHVTASLTRREADPAQLVVRLGIDEGWHVNANPASLPFLIPTAVEVRGAEAVIRYPEGRPLRSEFAPEEILVYEGRVEIPVTLESDASPAHVALRYQACDERICLPPARAELGVGAAP
jgi:hypothetical protein